MLDEQEMEYLYDDGEYFYFMNTENYEQMHLTKELLGDATNYLIPQLKVTVEFYEGKPISVELPATVDMTVVETEPGLKGRHGFQRHQARQDGNRPGGAGAAVHHRRRKDPRQYLRRHLSGKSLKQIASSSFRKYCSQIQQTTRSRSIRAIIGGLLARSRRSSATASLSSSTIRQVGSVLFGRGTAADHRFSRRRPNVAV